MKHLLFVALALSVFACGGQVGDWGPASDIEVTLVADSDPLPADKSLGSYIPQGYGLPLAAANGGDTEVRDGQCIPTEGGEPDGYCILPSGNKLLRLHYCDEFGAFSAWYDNAVINGLMVAKNYLEGKGWTVEVSGSCITLPYNSLHDVNIKPKPGLSPSGAYGATAFNVDDYPWSGNFRQWRSAFIDVYPYGTYGTTIAQFPASDEDEWRSCIALVTAHEVMHIAGISHLDGSLVMDGFFTSPTTTCEQRVQNFDFQMGPLFGNYLENYD